MKTRQRGSAKVTAKLVSIQRAGALGITGGLQTSPSDTLDALANLLPMELTIEKWCYRAVLRLASLPDKHPLWKPVKKCANHLVKKHRSPLHLLLQLLDAEIATIGTKATKTSKPVAPEGRPFRICIPPDKDCSKKEAQVASEEIQIFTDGSIINGEVGAAAILTRPGKGHRILHYHLGKASKYTIVDTELVGISLALQLIKTEKKARCHTMIGADSQAAIKAIQNELQ